MNDAEALALLGPKGTLFLSTSHSPTKKGRSKPSRRQLLWLEDDGRATVLKLADIERMFQRGVVVAADVSVFGTYTLRVKGAPQGGGALWLLDGEKTTRLRHFDGLKPEGVTLAPDGSLVVVFDEGAAPPKWLRMPAP